MFYDQIWARGASGPFRTVGSAVQNVADGGRIVVRRGTYSEPITITKPVTITTERGVATLGGLE